MRKSILLISFVLGFGIQQAQANQTWTIDVKGSVISWEGGKKVVNDKHNGTVKVKEGEVTTDAKGDLKAGKVVIDMKSIENEDVKSPKYKEKLVSHLMSEDFFYVDKFPTATFEIKSVVKKEEPSAKAKKEQKSKETLNVYHVTGPLTLRDKTQIITVPLQITSFGKSLEAKGSLTFDRTLWNVKYASGKFFNSLGDKVIKDEIDITFKLKADLKMK